MIRDESQIRTEYYVFIILQLLLTDGSLSWSLRLEFKLLPFHAVFRIDRFKVRESAQKFLNLISRLSVPVSGRISVEIVSTERKGDSWRHKLFYAIITKTKAKFKIQARLWRFRVLCAHSSTIELCVTMTVYSPIQIEKIAIPP